MCLEGRFSEPVDDMVGRKQEQPEQEVYSVVRAMVLVYTARTSCFTHPNLPIHDHECT